MVAIIIPTYNQFSYVIKCLKSLQKTMKDEYVVYLIDDASEEWSQETNDEIKTLLPEGSILHRFPTNDGCTRSWNYGLQLAKNNKCEFCIIANSDILFSEQWWERIKSTLEKFSLVGPITNAPGHVPKQNVNHYISNYHLSDKNLNVTAGKLKNLPSMENEINGFFMAAQTNDWWDNSFDEEHVFDPSNKLTGNETELQKRWVGKIGISNAFIFHYRSVSRKLSTVQGSCAGMYRDNVSVAVNWSYDASLMPHFFKHYHTMGINRFVITTKIPLETWKEEIGNLFHKLNITFMKPTPFRKERGLGDNHDQMRELIKTDWYMPVDPDEFIELDRSLAETIEHLETIKQKTNNNVILKTHLLDHFSVTGELTKTKRSPSLFEQYPVKYRFTRFMKMKDEKVILAPSQLEVTPGHHEKMWNYNAIEINNSKPSHHFKWRKGIVEALKKRIQLFKENNRPYWNESQQILDYIEKNQGIIVDALKQTKRPKFM